MDTSPFHSTDKALIESALKSSGFSAKQGETRILHNLNIQNLPHNVAIVGMGNKDNVPNTASVDPLKQNIREAVAKGVSTIASTFASSKAIHVHVHPFDKDAKSAAEACLLSTWSFDKYKSEANRGKNMSFQLVQGMDKMQKQWNEGTILANAQIHARHLSECPGNMMTPTLFAEYAESILADAHSTKLHVHGQQWIEAQKMGSFLSVARGSEEPPVFLEIEYDGTDGSAQDTYAMVGKGVTFDSGGISLKPSNDMAMMKGDMMGAAVTLSTMWAIQQLRLPIRVVAVIPLTENMPSGRATKPGDVITARNGKTIEVDNTDAEGRLILADAIHYICERHSPRYCVELSTLTGAMDIALGYHYTGAFCSTSQLWTKLEKAGYATGDPFWRMPMHPGYLKQMKSNVADLKNAGGRSGGSCSAAMFLSEFVPNMKLDGQNARQDVDGKTAFAHLDIAGVMHAKGIQGYMSSGMTGRPTRSMIEFMRGLDHHQ